MWLQETRFATDGLHARDVFWNVAHVFKRNDSGRQAIDDVPKAKLLAENLIVGIVVINGWLVIPVCQITLSGIDRSWYGQDAAGALSTAVSRERQARVKSCRPQ